MKKRYLYFICPKSLLEIFCVLMENDEEDKMVVVVGSRAHMEEESVVQVKRRKE